MELLKPPLPISPSSHLVRHRVTTSPSLPISPYPLLIKYTPLTYNSLSSMADLSGTWLGTYWQREVPTRFELTLLQGGNALSGNILDDSYLGEASLTGEVIGRKINFIKRYITNSGYSVRYTGTVSEDQNFMQGQWQVDSYNSGNWEAYRSEDNLSINLENLRVGKVPVSRSI